ncbi:LPXTG-anchored zinc carboxypeptidase [Streptococcus gordonii]|uniref:LPXTG-anchored zinc carboxypeptidase n=1 Tax=Streptococcus gordonii TaxID=1302 RepID=UPI001CC0B28D|nr:LPXTG-anchored zinc carboxypeptidase [Streptococcus gordonii]MBZ2133953.1 LPXTG cell wall anchor domain-containing protein [Streptococcus gordonii]MBZ2141238.1 LPXTG cell wall anchor domain-containing protein [Streptococcus gordonii]MBZ2143640.1 LPXTG cell wall anchor domain-containing protein [Streptococcus gordonii]MBZ2146022.1 LPXTG cell wall anchor domain-containing protein [Streptococcus gordonii]
MKDTYKKRLYTQVLSLSAAALLAVLAQGNVAADTLNPTEAPQEASPVSSLVENPTPVSAEKTEDHSDQPQTHTADKESQPVAKADKATSDTTSSPATEAENKQEASSENTTAPDKSETRVASSENSKVQLADSKVYMSEKASIEETVQEQGAQANKINWTLDNKPISEWKTWKMEDGTFSGDPFVTIEEKAEGDDLKLSLKFNELFGQDLSLRTPNNIRRTYRNFMGNHELVGVSEDLGLTIRKNIVLRPYEDFHTHDEMLASIEKSQQEAKDDRLVQIETIGKSAQGRDVKLGIISSDQKSIDDYLNTTNPKALTKPAEMLDALKNGTLDYKLPVLINNTHADEQPAIDIITGLFNTFATKDTISFQTTDANGLAKNVTLSVKELLKKFIFLFDFTENPDGDVANTRALANGIDPNRDTSYQANPETRTVAGLINKWNPIALYDIHGFVKEFLIEPATPPHDPNFEYDLLSKNMLENAHHMGRAGVANSKYDSYIIPKLDWGDGWDDSFSGYTGVYAMYHGILGHTIEIPEGNQESYKAGYHAVLGGISYLSQNPDKLMEMRLNFYLRGINKIEDPKAENELVGPDGKVVGRIKNGQKKFFPDYYVIPMGLDKNNDSQQAFNMIEYFKRNGVTLKELKEDVGNYKKGDLVVDMAQAKRGYANHILYKGSNESAWSAMYAELLVNFPDMRGFKAKAVFKDKLFDGKLGDVTALRATRTSEINHSAPYYVIANTSDSAVKAVNQAIRQGKKVYLTDDGYIVDTPTFENLLGDYAIYGDALYKVPNGPSLKALKVYSPPHQFYWAGVDSPTHTALALKNLGFDLVNTPEEADVVVLESNNFDKSLVGLKPTIVVGGSAMQRLEKLGLIDGFDAEKFSGGSDFEGLMKAIIDDQDPLTSGYNKNDLFYSNSGNWIAKVPANFKTLATIAGSDYYIAGWWPGNEKLANKIVAISGKYNENPLFVYAGNPTNRLHTIHFYRWISNAVFGSQLANLTDYILPSPTPNPIPQPQPLTPPTYQAPSKTYQAPNQTRLDFKPATKVDPVQEISLTNSRDSLPKTGTQEMTEGFKLASILIACSAGLFLLKKKEN